MFSQSNTPTRKTLTYLTGFMLFVVLSTFLAPQAFAAKPCWDENHNKIECPSNNTLGAGSPTDVILHGTDVWEESFRHCTAGSGLTEASGNYTCSSPGEYVHYCEHELGAPIASRKNRAWLCGVLTAHGDEHFPFVVDEYSYGWTENCSGGSCNVEIRLTVSEMVVSEYGDTAPIMALTHGYSDRVEIIMSAIADVSADTGNPFHEDLINLDVYFTETDFKKPGSMRTYVTCGRTVLPAQIMFTSVPTP